MVHAASTSFLLPPPVRAPPYTETLELGRCTHRAAHKHSIHLIVTPFSRRVHVFNTLYEIRGMCYKIFEHQVEFEFTIKRNKVSAELSLPIFNVSVPIVSIYFGHTLLIAVLHGEHVVTKA